MTKQSPDDALPLFARDKSIASLKQTPHGVQFDRSKEGEGNPLSWGLPFDMDDQNDGKPANEKVTRYFSNLLPEGDALESLRNAFGVRRGDVVGTLALLGHDTAGALSFGGPAPGSSFKRKIDIGELAERVADPDTASLLVWDGVNQLSLSGVQPKLNVGILGDDLYLAGQDVGNYILKFDTNSSHRTILAELYCMMLADASGIEVPGVEYRRIGEHPALLVRRFDRSRDEDFLLKHHIVDGCQLLGLPPDYKYEQNFGPGRDVKHIRDGANLPDLFKAARNSFWGDEAKHELLSWTLFNLLIGNGDAHGKNVSFYVAESGLMAPAPFYDLVPTAFLMNDENLAMAIDDNFDMNSITAYNLLGFASKVDIEPKRMKRMLSTMVDNLEYAMKVVDISSVSIRASELQSELKPHLKKRLEHFREQLEDFYFVERSLI